MKRGFSLVITTVILTLISISLLAIVYVAVNKQVSEGTSNIDKKLQAIGNIELKIEEVSLIGGKIIISVRNLGSQDISSFIVRITSRENVIYINNSICLANKEKLGSLNTRDIIIIPAPFGNFMENYSLVEVYPKFEFSHDGETTEEIAETGKSEFKLSDGNAAFKTPEIKSQCSDGIDNDKDGFTDLNDMGCSAANDENESDSNVCRTDFKSIDGNLVLNPYAECDNDNNGIPDNWIKSEADAAHILAWQNDPVKSGNKALLNEFKGGTSNSFSWNQKIYAKPNTWYEFSADFAVEGAEPILTGTKEISRASSWTGVQLDILNSSSGRIQQIGLWMFGPELSDWDNNAWVYRTYNAKGFESWRSVKKYYKTPVNTTYIAIRTYSYPIGKIYTDNFYLKEVSGDGKMGIFRKKGILTFVKYQGNDFFPIFMFGHPTTNGKFLNVSEMKKRGFNVIAGQDYMGLSKDAYEKLIRDENMTAAIGLTYNLYKTGNSAQNWVNDPSHTAAYWGAGYNRGLVDKWKNSDVLLFFVSAYDEIDSHPAETGSYIPNLKTMQAEGDYIRENVPGGKIAYNFGGSKSPYTGNVEDRINYYFPLTDIITYTTSLPVYPAQTTDPYLGKRGEFIRWCVDSLNKSGQSKPVLANIVGVYSWTGKNRIPFNLQRFQAWDQIINGATGLSLYVWTLVHLEDAYANEHFQQISRIATELSSLQGVLLEKEFCDEWQVSDDRVEIMMKKHSGKIYLFSANTHYEDLNNVKITLDSKYTINSVKAVNEIVNGEINHPVNRTIAFNSDKHSFNDNFVGDYNAGADGLNSPGYSVHIYEVEYS